MLEDQTRRLFEESRAEGVALVLSLLGVGAHSALAQSPILWKRVGSRAIDVLSQLSGASVDDVAYGAVIDAIFTSGRDVAVDALVDRGARFHAVAEGRPGRSRCPASLDLNGAGHSVCPASLARRRGALRLPRMTHGEQARGVGQPRTCS